MKTISIGQTNDKRRNAWQPPVVTKVAIGAETKSTPDRETGNTGLTEPQPPSPPATKLGFAFEMAFPMSSRSEQ
jgi:hypothetical protein